MQTIFKEGIWKILHLFYTNRNKPLHLREIARKIKMNESSISRHLNNLAAQNILKINKEANLKKFHINKNKIPEIFPLFDNEKLNNFHLLRRNAIKEYISKSDKKPVALLIFGSTAKETARKDSDIDVLEINYGKIDNKDALKYAEAQTGINIQLFQITEKEFRKELNLKQDNVIQSAINTGFPVFNSKYYYELVYNE